jgi:hypothetical protein
MVAMIETGAHRLPFSSERRFAHPVSLDNGIRLAAKEAAR